jgi:hypothetical protein
MHKVFEHIDMLSIGIVAALHSSYTQPTWLRFLASGSLVVQIDVFTSLLRLTVTSNCFPYLY